jgi:diguanylate cyclase (GGDEF)-like protein
LQLNALTITLLAATVINGILALISWRRRSAKSSKALFFLLLAITQWCLSSALEGISTTLFYKILFSVIAYIGITTTPVLLLIFISQYTNFDKWITKRNLFFFFIIPALTLIMAATNTLHGLLWSDISLKYNDIAGIYGFYIHGPFYWIHMVYSYTLVIAAIIILLFSLIKFKKLYSVQTRILLYGSIIPFAGNIIYSFTPNTIKGIEITPVCFTVTGILIFFAILHFKLLDFSPVAWELIIENLNDGVMVFDNNKMVIEFNENIKHILNIENIKIGENREQLFAEYPEINLFCNYKNYNKPGEVCIKKSGKKHYLKIRYLPLFDRKKKIIIGKILILNDITSQKIAEQKLLETKNLLSDIIDFLPDATFAINNHGEVISWNKSMEKITGIQKNEIIGKADYMYSVLLYGKSRPMLIDLVLKRDPEIEKLYDYIEFVEDKIIAELHLKDKKITNNKTMHIWSIASTLYDSNGNIIGAIESFRDITERKIIERKLHHISFHDSLTGLYNRAFFREELKRIDKIREKPISIIMADLNGLKLVNDAFGHEQGDILLKKTSKIIKNCCRSSDIIARWGGDEFIILLPKTDATVAAEIIDRIKNKCNNSTRSKIPISISLGFGTKLKDSDKLNAVLLKAEESMYKHKLLETKSVQNQIIKSLTKTLYEKNIETANHSERVIALSLKLGEKINLGIDMINDLKLHAKLHDIGKVSVDENILKKKEKLTSEEWKKIKKHSEAGYRIASSSPLLAPIAEYILTQHEWWNGEGYPMKLKGYKIPLISRIVAITDAFDSMIHDRPYRKAMTVKEAVLKLKESAGTQFDPDLIKKFLRIIKKEHSL